MVNSLKKPVREPDDDLFVQLIGEPNPIANLNVIHLKIANVKREVDKAKTTTNAACDMDLKNFANVC